MPMMNTTIDDASPLIKYQPDGAWTQNTANEAYHDSYTMTTWQNASATFQFQGTWVMVSGSRNPAHGNYTVSLDNFLHQANGSLPDPGEWQAPLFISGPLEEGMHTLTISNDGWDTLDIDSITWSCGVGGNKSTGLQKTNVDDTDSAFSWFPSGSWSTNPSNITMFRHETGHSTSQLNASVNFTFSVSDAVAIYGTTGPGQSLYSVSPPHRPAQEFDASRDTFSSNVLLYFGDRFGPGNHTVTLVNQSPGLFQVDYAVVHSAITPSPSVSASSLRLASTGPPTIPANPNSITHGNLSTGVIVAISFAAFLFLLLIAALLFLLQRNKTLWYRLQRGYKVQSQFDVGTPPNGSVVPLPFSASPQMRSKANLQRYNNNDNDGDDFEAQPLNRAVTADSHLTASTLVAEVGSSSRRPSSLKALRLASRWGSGTPSSSQPRFSGTDSMRNSASTRHLTLSPTTRHLSRSPSTRHLLQEESHYYDPHAAAVAGLEEVPEDSVDDILRHSIQRTEPSISSLQHWQLTLD
ncbi:hypothetical protein MSAN_00738300 [Mycena sanguinolenta]|uniref:Uncharacterized protein n=1 Tax=Mycena sanguinolenta TaxID=230812 RepID=A0A8H6Z656_9AGAR|nr:hypothetical protein MSAN_00738300 [Mycena sanguinolenta]